MPDFDRLFLEQTLRTLAQLDVLQADRLDAATHFVEEDLTFVRQQTYEVFYGLQKLLGTFIPVATDTPRGVRHTGYKMRDRVGRAELIDDDTNDLPTVSSTKQRFLTQLRDIGLKYGYSIADLEAAIYAGEPLDRTEADVAAMATSERHDEVAAFGDANLGLAGFFNHASIPVIAATGDFDALTDDQVLADLTRCATTVVTNTLEVIKPDTMLFDTESFEKLNGRRIGDTSETLLNFFVRTNRHINNVDSSSKLSLADAEGDGPRIVTYKRDPMVVEAVAPIIFEQRMPQPKDLRLNVPCRGKTGGVQVRYPKGAVYMDGSNG